MSPATGRDYLYDLPPAKPVSYNSVFRQMVGATEEGIALQAACIDVSTPNREGGGRERGTETHEFPNFSHCFAPWQRETCEPTSVR